jgi:hypothetical protein
MIIREKLSEKLIQQNKKKQKYLDEHWEKQNKSIRNIEKIKRMGDEEEKSKNKNKKCKL